MERLKDDPYYIIDDRLKGDEVDIDSIPVVRLEDPMVFPTGKVMSLLPKLYSSLYRDASTPACPDIK